MKTQYCKKSRFARKFSAYVLAGATFLAAAGDWIPLKDKNVEYRVHSPARNACEVEIRQVRPAGRKIFVVHTRFRQHRLQGSNATEQNEFTEQVKLDGGIAATIHITDCESVTTVDVQ